MRVHVLAIDIRDQRDRRGERQERSIALVGFDIIGAPRPGRRCSERAEPSTDHRRGIEPGTLEHEGDHRRRRGLATCAPAIAMP